MVKKIKKKKTKNYKSRTMEMYILFLFANMYILFLACDPFSPIMCLSP